MDLKIIQPCDHSNESYGEYLPSGAVYFDVQGGSISQFESVPLMNSLKLSVTVLLQNVPDVLFVLVYNIIIMICQSVDEILKCDYLNKSY